MKVLSMRLVFPALLVGMVIVGFAFQNVSELEVVEFGLSQDFNRTSQVTEIMVGGEASVSVMAEEMTLDVPVFFTSSPISGVGMMEMILTSPPDPGVTEVHNEPLEVAPFEIFNLYSNELDPLMVSFSQFVSMQAGSYIDFDVTRLGGDSVYLVVQRTGFPANLIPDDGQYINRRFSVNDDGFWRVGIRNASDVGVDLFGSISFYALD